LLCFVVPPRNSSQLRLKSTEVDWGSVVFRRLQLKACELIRRLIADCQILAALAFSPLLVDLSFESELQFKGSEKL
jgi:hypothetical protein